MGLEASDREDFNSLACVVKETNYIITQEYICMFDTQSLRASLVRLLYNLPPIALINIMQQPIYVQVCIADEYGVMDMRIIRTPHIDIATSVFSVVSNLLNF